MAQLDVDIQNYNKVKDLVLSRLVHEGYIDEDDAEEFCERCHVLVYKGKWFSKWFKKNVKLNGNENANEEGTYMRIVELQDKESDVDKLLRRTTGDYDD